jgi:hypothetical protein
VCYHISWSLRETRLAPRVLSIHQNQTRAFDGARSWHTQMSMSLHPLGCSTFGSQRDRSPLIKAATPTMLSRLANSHLWSAWWSRPWEWQRSSWMGKRHQHLL